MNIILIILVFGVIIFFHELGHFIVAKLNHIDVIEFSVGFGPKLFQFTKNGTMYTLRLLPLGGYCMMLSDAILEEEAEEGATPEVNENSFDQKSVWARMITTLAGPIANFILAFLLAMVVIYNCGSDPAKAGYVYSEEYLAEYVASLDEDDEDYETYLENVEELREYYGDSYPAAEAGIEAGDTVLKINGSTVKNFRELQIYLQIYGDGTPVTLKIQKEDGTIYDVDVTPTLTTAGYKFGIVSSGYEIPENFLELVKYSAYEVRYWVKATVLSLKLILTRQVSSEDISGPVGVASTMNDTFNEAASYGVITLVLNWVNYIVLLSANLGVMNLLPIPGLDGGRFLFQLIELITRKKVPKEKENIVTVIGFVIVMLLMIVILFNDIKNVFF